MTQITENQIERTITEWSNIAKETVEVEMVRETLYAYGSEIACLRLAYAFRDSRKDIRCEYSLNLQTWYFSLNAYRTI